MKWSPSVVSNSSHSGLQQWSQWSPTVVSDSSHSGLQLAWTLAWQLLQRVALSQLVETLLADMFGDVKVDVIYLCWPTHI